jgi:hypothetical protein
VFFGCFILVACGGDQQDVTCKDCAPLSKIKVVKRVRIKQKIDLDGTASKPGPNGGALSFIWTLLNKPEDSNADIFNSDKPQAFFTPDKPGIYTIQLIVNDGFTDSKPCIQEIETLSDQPVAKAKIFKHARLTEKLELDGSDSTPGFNAGTLSYQWTLEEKPEGSNSKLFNANTVHPYLYPDKIGLYKFQLVVEDDFNTSPPDFVSFTPLNSEPVARVTCTSCYDNNSMRVGDPVLLNGTRSEDIDNDPLTCQWTLKYRPNGSSAKLSDTNAITSSFIPDVQGEYKIQLIVNDGKVDSTPEELLIQVHGNPVASAQILKAVRVREKLELDGSKSIPGSDATKLTYRWSIIEKPENSNVKLYNPKTVTPYFIPDLKGLYVIQLIVNDGINNSKPYRIEFIPLNTRPVAHATYNDPVRIFEKVLLDASSSEDIDHDKLTYKWKLIYRPDNSNATLSDANAITPTFTADHMGDYIVQLIVNDGLSNSEPVSLKIQVHDNPAAKASFEQTLPVKQVVKLDGSESQPGIGGGDLDFLWTLEQKPTGSVAMLSDPTSAKPTFIADKPGKYIIKLVVNDGISSSFPFILEYETLNSKPIARCEYNEPIYVNQTVQIDATKSSDLDNDPLTYQWKLSFKPIDSDAILSGATGSKPSFIADRPGKYIVQLVVNDGKEDSNTYTLIINTENSRPISNAGEDATVFEGETVQLDGSKSTDIDGSQLTFRWTVNEKPDGSMAQLSNVNKINPVFTPDVPGIYVIELVVNDGTAESDPDTMEIIANASVDLKPGPMDLSGIITDPETLLVTGNISVDIINTGTRPIPGEFQIILFEDINHNNQFEETDTKLAIRTVKEKPQGNDVVTVNLTAGYKDDEPLIEPKVSFLDNIIFVMIDPLNTIPERDESNNTGSSKEGDLCRPPANDFSPQLAWEWTKSLHNDFPMSNQVVCTPIVGNLTDDNKDGVIDLNDIPDIVFITFEGTNDEKKGIIRAISGDGASEHFSIGPFSYNDKHFEAFPNYNPALGDIDNDGIVEILVVVNDQIANKWLAVFENDGSLKWISEDYSSSQMISPASISIADMDANGVAEIIIGNFLISNTGQTLMIGKEDNGLNNSSVVDIDLDSQMEIIAGRTAYEADGKIIWHINELAEGFNAIANFDNDDHPEIVMVGRGKIALVEHTGEIIWGPKQIAPSGPFRGDGGPPMIADVDGDGQLEIGVAGASRFSLFNGNGSLAWTAEIRDPSSVTSASAFDFDGNGSSEIVYRDSYSVKIFDGRNGNVLYEDIAGSTTFIEMPVIADVDNDNSAEIIVPCNSSVSGDVAGIRVYEDAKDYWVNTRKIWNQHAYMTTNIHEDGRIPKAPINNWEIYNNFRQNQMKDPFGCKDISSSYIRFDTSNCPDEVIITARIGNGGNLHVPADTLVSFYLGNPAGNGRLLAEHILDKPIKPGQWVDISVKLENTGTQINNIFVVADSNNKLWESNEDNNMSQRSFTCDSQ